MTTSPVSPSPFHKVIKAVSEVRTRNGIAALTILVLFLCFVFTVFLVSGLDRMILSILILLLLTGFAFYTIKTTKTEINNEVSPKERLNVRKREKPE